ncbi:hypothetical protein DFH07DRAFT_743437 [Mycena maculata]|uniref:Uncharacterized protein n=1 Tax=Mycena maculata TaxID=230809 RepID=A0AAD7NCW2_9AGAR|nr:hypothetical protein DFH07DRAFT_743437 [Mycena maculata]
MPRPTPLRNSSQPYPHYDTQLTPRTPHSRAGRAEEAYFSYELEQVDGDDDEYISAVQQQNEPLLASSASDSFPPQVGYRSRGDDYDENAPRKDKRGLSADKIMARLPLALYSSVAAMLLVLVFFSLREPEALKKYVGATTDPDGAEISTPAVDLEPIATPVADVPPAGPTVATNIILISYENYTSFPLDPLEYRAECIQLNSGVMAPYPYWDTTLRPLRDVPHFDEQVGYSAPSDEPPVCSRTITYQLDGWAGLMADVALMAQAAALARERNATFFVQDTFWNRGHWTDYFEDVQVGQPGPEPGCRPPPPEEYVACPRTARHWIINSRTSRYHFGHPYEHYQDPYAHNLNRFKGIFNFAWQSLAKTIRPNAHSAELIQWARQELLDKVTQHYQNPRTLKGVQDDGPAMGYLGVHIRRGDRKPTWRVYNSLYIPISDFVDAVVESWSRLSLELSADDKLVQPFVYVASDSPVADQEFAESFSPERVFSLSRSQREELRAIASPGEYFQDNFKELDEDVRVQSTRGMVVDFALLSGAWSDDGDLIPEGTICTASSVVCRLAAIGLGWKRAFGDVGETGRIADDHRWMDVDMKGRIVPVWEAFEGAY